MKKTTKERFTFKLGIVLGRMHRQTTSFKLNRLITKRFSIAIVILLILSGFSPGFTRHEGNNFIAHGVQVNRSNRNRIPTITTLSQSIVSFDVRVSTSSDDAEENNSGRVSLNSSDLELVDERSNQIVGIRFNGIAVPQGATISSANIQFKVDETKNTDICTLSIHGERTTNASTFTNSRRNISSRLMTTAFESWSPEPWLVVGAKGPDQRTPNIASVIQEIVNQPGWSEGNSLVIIISGTGKRVAESFNGDQADAPILHIEYEAEASNNPPVALDDTGTVAEGGTFFQEAPGVLGNDSDPDGDPLILNTTVLNGPTNGTLSLNPDGSYSYSHDGSETTSDSFEYEVCDDGPLCDTASVYITVTPVDDDPPVLVYNTGSLVGEGDSVPISPMELRYVDEQPSSSVMYSVTYPTGNGQLELTSNPDQAISRFSQANIDDGLLIYIHDGSHTSSDSFQFSVDDGLGNILADQYFAITISPSNTGTGALSQLTGTDGCVSEDGTNGECADGKALDGAERVVVSPDGKNVYVALETSNAVSIFARDETTGALTQLPGREGCVSDSGTQGVCTLGIALVGPRAVALSPDGKHVYVAASGSAAVSIFSRDQLTGALTQLSGIDGCISETGSSGACADGRALDGARYITVSPDGNNVYVASFFSDAVAVFSRNLSTGALTQLTGFDGCVSETGNNGTCSDGKALERTRAVIVSPDGKNVYVASQISNWSDEFPNRGAVSIFSRNVSTGAITQLAGTDGCISETGTNGACVNGKTLARAFDLTVSPDGRYIYVTAFKSDSISVFSRDQTTGILAQLGGTDGCISESGTRGACTDGVALDGPRAVTISPDGNNIYVALAFSDAVSILSRDQTTGVLTQLAGMEGCISETGTGGACVQGIALDGARSVIVSPDGKNVYVGTFVSSSIAIFSRR
ncbi:MAG: beta-propeller fold lactonase family protein [Chloroflexota bacterium]|nr:MAG: beta-propeller fold lactonase family protein [Chloroflexota bacterium]